MHFKSLIPLLFLVLAFPVFRVSAQSFPVLKWQKFFGTELDDIPYVIEKCKDGNLIIGGTTAEGESTDLSKCTDIWIIKVDTLGQLLWERRFGGSGCDELRDVAITPDSGVIFVGITSSFIQHPEKGQENFQGDFFIGKLNNQGEIDWLKTYGGIDVDQAYAIARSRNFNEYMVVGASASQNFDVQTQLGMTNLWGIKVNSEGEKRTTFALGGHKHDWAYSLTPCRNSDYVFAGFTSSDDLDDRKYRHNGDGWVGRVDRYGRLKWQQVFSGRFEDYFASVTEDRSRNLVLCGNFESSKSGKQFWFLKLNAQGKKLEEKIFGDRMDEYATSIKESSNGGYVMTGYSKSYSLGNKYIKGGEDFWVFRLNKAGDVIWMNTFGGRDNERGRDIIEYRPGVYFAVGEKLNNFELHGAKSKGMDFWLLRIEEERCKDVPVNLYCSAREYSTLQGRNIKFRVDCEGATKIIWDFGDGDTSTQRSPTHSYSMPGIYQVKCTVLFNENCSRTVKLPKYLTIFD